MPDTVFRTGDVADRFSRDGYVVIPFLDRPAVERLRDLYHRYHREEDVRQHTIPSYARGFYASTFNNDPAYRRTLSLEVTAACRPALDRVFARYKVFYAGFLVKLPDPDGRLRVHQDPTLVDEARFTPVNVWCPLQDIDERNGALRMLPGSHRLFSGPRATSIPPPWEHHEELIASRMTSVHLPAGAATLFTQATLHASEPNVSDQPRIAATLFVCDESASLQTAHRDHRTPDRIDLYAQADDFMLRNAQFSSNSTGKPELGRYIGSLPYDSTPIAEEAIRRLCAG